MADKLKIYACTGVGDTTKTDYDYWRDNVNVLNNTQAVNTIITLIDAAYNKLAYTAISDEERLRVLNEIDLYAVCLTFAQSYSGNARLLRVAGKVIGSAYKNGLFDCVSLDNDVRDNNLDLLTLRIAEGVDAYEKANAGKETKDEIITDKEFTKWWDENVISRDKVGMSEADRELLTQCMDKYMSKAVSGWEDDKNVSKYLNDASNYFLYLYFTPEQLAKLPERFTKKANGQMRVYNYVKSLFVGVYGSEATLKQTIYNNITAKYEQTPEKVCALIASGKKVEGVGLVGELTVAMLVRIIIALIPLLTALFKGIIDYAKTVNAAKYQAFNEQLVDDNMTTDADLSGLEFPKQTDWSKWGLIGAGVIGVIWLMKK